MNAIDTVVTDKEVAYRLFNVRVWLKALPPCCQGGHGQLTGMLQSSCLLSLPYQCATLGKAAGAASMASMLRDCPICLIAVE